MDLPFFSRPYPVYPKFMPKFDGPAMIGRNLEPQKLITTKRNLE